MVETDDRFEKRVALSSVSLLSAIDLQKVNITTAPVAPHRVSRACSPENVSGIRLVIELLPRSLEGPIT